MKASLWVERAIEACWLGAVALVPLATTLSGQTVPFVSAPKVFVLRSLAVLAVVLAAAAWSLRSPTSRWNPIVIAGLVIFLVTAFSAALSPLPAVSIEGVRPGWDSYALYSVGAYVAIFVVVAFHLRSPKQFERLAWTVTGTAIVLGFYGVLQRFGLDPLGIPMNGSRVPLTMGNPVFAASALLLMIPVTLAFWQTKRDQMGPREHVLVGTALVVFPVISLLFTLTRGALLGFAVAMVTFGVLTVWLKGWRATIPGWRVFADRR